MTENEVIEQLEIFPEWNREDQWLDVGDMEELVNICVKALKEVTQYRAIGAVEECREARERHNKACSHQLAYYDHSGHRYNGQVRFTEGIGNHDGQGNPLTLR